MAYISTSQSVDLGEDWVSADVTPTSSGDRLQLHLGAGYGLAVILTREEWAMVQSRANKAWAEYDRRVVIEAAVREQVDAEAREATSSPFHQPEEAELAEMKADYERRDEQWTAARLRQEL